MPGRRKGRELAVQMLYQWDVTRPSMERLQESFWSLREQPAAARGFAIRLVEGTLANLEAIDGLITEHTEKWRLERIALVDRNVLRMAICEFLHEDTPKKVVINEALEVTKKYSTPEAVQFVNGILDAVLTKIETREEAR
jgi:N utilization substance protein B